MKTSAIVNEQDVKYLIRRDKIFASIADQYGIPPNWSREPGFISLSRIILEQQVSLASANAHFQKLKDYIVDFTPVNIIKLSDEEMRNCQISRQKTVYLRSLSSAIIGGQLDLSAIGSSNEDVLRTRLTSVKGIGQWTTDIYLMFCLQAKDIFTVGDIAVVNTVRELAGVHSAADIISISDDWKPVRSLATYFLWHYYLKKRNRVAS